MNFEIYIAQSSLLNAASVLHGMLFTEEHNLDTAPVEVERARDWIAKASAYLNEYEATIKPKASA